MYAFICVAAARLRTVTSATGVAAARLRTVTSATGVATARLRTPPKNDPGSLQAAHHLALLRA